MPTFERSRCMCGDISGYKRPSKVSRASAAACWKMPCTRLGSVIHTMIQLKSISHASVGSAAPFTKYNLAFIAVPAGIAFHVSEELETQQDDQASHHPTVSVDCSAAGLGTRNAAVLKLAALTKGSHRLQTTPWRLVYQ